MSQNTVNSFDEYKNLTDEEKDYFIYDTLTDVKNGITDIARNITLSKLDERYDKRYAKLQDFKLIKTIVFTAVGTILIGVLGAGIGLVVK